MSKPKPDYDELKIEITLLRERFEKAKRFLKSYNEEDCCFCAHTQTTPELQAFMKELEK